MPASESPDPARAEVLARCREAEALWRQAPGRQLVLLFDGSGNILGSQCETHVVRLLRVLAKHDPQDARRPSQIVYYDPGVGSTNEFPPAGLAASLAQRLRRLAALALGRGAFENIAQAYEFLCQHWRPGDRIFLFGFSRGAFTARAVGGMVNMYGLVHAPGLALRGALVRAYFARGSARRSAFAGQVRESFALGRLPLVHFVGVWDTVETIGGGLMGGLRITNSRSVADKRFVHVRHALALHETRRKYAPRDYTPPHFSEAERAHRSFEQRWFRGAHGDVGGAYARAGLADITLGWMLQEAMACGLLLEREPALAPRPLSARHDASLDSPLWTWTGLDARPRGARAELDASAVPLAGAAPPRRSQGARRVPLAGGLLFLLAGVLAWRHWTAGWPSYAFFLPAYALWLAWPMGWALRTLSGPAIVAGSALPWLARHAHRWMWALVGLDASRLMVAARWPQATLFARLLGAGALLCVAALLGVVAWAALRWRPGRTLTSRTYPSAP